MAPVTRSQIAAKMLSNPPQPNDAQTIKLEVDVDNEALPASQDRYEKEPSAAEPDLPVLPTEIAADRPLETPSDGTQTTAAERDLTPDANEKENEAELDADVPSTPTPPGSFSAFDDNMASPPIAAHHLPLPQEIAAGRELVRNVTPSRILRSIRPHSSFAREHVPAAVEDALPSSPIADQYAPVPEAIAAGRELGTNISPSRMLRSIRPHPSIATRSLQVTVPGIEAANAATANTNEQQPIASGSRVTRRTNSRARTPLPPPVIDWEGAARPSSWYPISLPTTSTGVTGDDVESRSHAPGKKRNMEEMTTGEGHSESSKAKEETNKSDKAEQAVKGAIIETVTAREENERPTKKNKLRG